MCVVFGVCKCVCVLCMVCVVFGVCKCVCVLFGVFVFGVCVWVCCVLCLVYVSVCVLCIVCVVFGMGGYKQSRGPTVCVHVYVVCVVFAVRVLCPIPSTSFTYFLQELSGTPSAQNGISFTHERKHTRLAKTVLWKIRFR